MKYVLFCLLVLPALSRAQSAMAGLGHYVIGSTMPDSLDRSEFKEEDQSYVKGTIALPCSHIRSFTAATALMNGVAVRNVVLVFYDSRLSKIACDYSDLLDAFFLKRYGAGVRQPTKNVPLCTEEKDKHMVMWGEIWRSADVVSVVMHWKGYGANCQLGQGARLIIASQRLSALSSDCDINPADSLAEEFSKSQRVK